MHKYSTHKAMGKKRHVSIKKEQYPYLHKLLFWSILIFSFIIRVVALEGAPSGVNQDEAMAAVDAWALSKYGTDRFGMQLPVHFTAWGYGQMSVLLSYCMVPFIKVFGFTTFAIRMPMVVASTCGVALIYLISQKMFSKNLSLAIMAFAAVNPWHFMQSRWSLDCNLFPHVFLLAFYLMLCGFEKRKYLYWSMVCFGLTFYCYGIAVYTVPVFLFLYAAYCLAKKIFSFREILISAGIFLIVALPEILVMVINMFGLSTIETPLFTMAYFPDSIRSNDILLLNFSWEQLWRNAQTMYSQVFLQKPDALYNALPDFGPMYHISSPLLVVGIVSFIRRAFSQKDTRKKAADIAVLGFLLAGIWVGLVTFQVNLNRINIIFYPMMILTVYGIHTICSWFQKYALYIRGGFVAGYAILAIMFMTQYFGDFPEQISVQFHEEYLEILKEADSLEEYDVLYLSSHVGWMRNYMISEILLQYVCQIDPLYYQGLTNETGGRTLLPYSQRYRFVDMPYQSYYDTDALYVMHDSEYASIISQYPDCADIILSNGDFVAVDFR